MTDTREPVNLTQRTRLCLLLLAGLVGFIHVYPDLCFLQQPAYRASGMHLITAADETYYLSRVTAAMGGDRHLGNVAIYEHRHDPYLMPPVPELVYATIGRLLHLSVKGVDLLATFALPAAILLLLYLWLGYFTASTGTRILGALAVVCGLSWLSLDPKTFALIWNQGIPLSFVRPVSPSWHVFCLMLALLALFQCLTTASWLSALTAAVAGGLVWYTNIYFSSFLLALMGLLWLGAIWTCDRQQAIQLLVIALGIGCFAIPSLVNWSQVKQAPGFHDLWIRYGAEHTRRLIVPLILVIATGLVLVGFRPAQPRQRWWLLACLAAGWACLNQQLLTGFTVQPSHWQSFVNKPFAILGIVLTAGLWLSRLSPRWRQGIGVTTAALVLGISWLVQVRYYDLMSRWLEPHLSIGAVCQWLRRHVTPEDVVVTNPMDFVQAEYLSTYANSAVYISDPFFIISLLPTKEIEHRYLAALHFYGYTQEETQPFFQSVGGGGLFVGFQALSWPTTDPAAQQRYLAHLASTYQQMVSQEPLQNLSPYRATYALLSHGDVTRLQARQPALLAKLAPVYEDSAFTLYQLHPSTGSGRTLSEAKGIRPATRLAKESGTGASH